MESENTNSKLRFIGYVKATAPKSLRHAVEAGLIFVLALIYLYVTGNKVQMVAEMNWAIAFILALSFTFIVRLFNEVLRQPTITSATRKITLALFVILCAGAFWFGYHGTVKRMDNAEIEEFRNKTYYKAEYVQVRNIIGTDGVIRDKTFEGCAILGPACLYVIGDIYLEESRTSCELNFIILPDNVSTKNGTVLIDNCKFKDSWFENVSVLGHADEIEKIKQGIVKKTGSVM